METRDSRKIVNFLIHPNEVIVEENLHVGTERRASNYISYLLSDLLRRKMKQRNLGSNALRLFEREVAFWKNSKYAFKRIKDVCIE